MLKISNSWIFGVTRYIVIQNIHLQFFIRGCLVKPIGQQVPHVYSLSTNWSTSDISFVYSSLSNVCWGPAGCDVYVPLCNIVDVSNVCWRLYCGVYANLSVAESNKATCKKVDSVYSSTTQEHRTVLKQNLLRILSESTVHGQRNRSRRHWPVKKYRQLKMTDIGLV